MQMKIPVAVASNSEDLLGNNLLTRIHLRPQSYMMITQRSSSSKLQALSRRFCESCKRRRCWEELSTFVMGPGELDHNLLVTGLHYRNTVTLHILPADRKESSSSWRSRITWKLLFRTPLTYYNKTIFSSLCYVNLSSVPSTTQACLSDSLFALILTLFPYTTFHSSISPPRSFARSFFISLFLL